MPTGYTYNVVDGKLTEFPAFAMQCARAFGALITMRDDDADAPIPDEIKPNCSYHDERLASSKLELRKVQAMTNAEAAAAAETSHAEALKHRADYLAQQNLEAERLNAMLAKVRAWHPPTPDHTRMKDFMIEQLTISMPGTYAPAIPELLDGPTWRQRQIDKLSNDVVRYQTEINKEIERAAGRTEWLKKLRASLA